MFGNRAVLKITAGLALTAGLFFLILSSADFLGYLFDSRADDFASTSSDPAPTHKEDGVNGESCLDEKDKDRTPKVVPDKIIKGEIHDGESFSHALLRAGLDPAISKALITGFSGVVDFRRCRPGDTFSVALDANGGLLNGTYSKGPIEIYSLAPDPAVDNGFKVFREKVEVERRVMKLSGEVSSSLFLAFAKCGVGSKITMAFCDIFASQIDFNTESWPGDHFDLIYEEYTKDGHFLGYGKILAARYEGHLIEYEAYYFHPEDREFGSYYDPQGQELGSSFLRSPLPVYRVTSTFTRRRLHPILKVYRPHYGVDLAAPVGTPVMAVADGRVIFAGWSKGFGRRVIIKHPGGIQTSYGHLYRFGKGIKKGVRVTQKRIIGYVGASGLATGPHLDYRIKVNGRFKNPFSMKFKPKSRLQGAAYEKFQEICSRWAPFLHHYYRKDEILVETKKIKDFPEGWTG